MADSTPQASLFAPDESSNALATQAHRCARPYCSNQARKGKRWGKYCSDKCRMEVWAYRHRRKAHLCGPGKRRDPEREFARWLDSQDGQTVYVEALKRAQRLRAAGYTRYSVDALIHSIRFDRGVKLGPSDDYRINDHVTSRLARLLMAREPDLAGFFETRQLRGTR